MITIMLKEKQSLLLKQVLKQEDKKNLFQLKNNTISISNNYQNNFEILIDMISNYFMKYGIKQDSEPNQLGLELEDLNDVFIEKLQTF